MKKLILTIAILISTSVFALSAQEEEINTTGLEARNGLGVAYFSPDIGGGSDQYLGGLCYQHWFNDKVGLEAGGAVNWDPKSTYNPLDYNIYCEGDYILFTSNFSSKYSTRLFTWGVIGHTGKIDSKYNVEKGEYEEGEFFPNFRAGAGFGFDIIFFKHISVPLKFGFTGSLNGAGFTFGGGIKYLW